MPFIENVSRDDIIHGWHTNAGPNSMVIQISDITKPHPEPNNEFRYSLQCQFEDIDIDDPELGSINDFHAHQIAHALRYAYSKGANVVVHCHHGLCRSGAVVEAGMWIGFKSTGRNRLPNVLVARKVIECFKQYPASLPIIGVQSSLQNWQKFDNESF